MYTIHMCTPSPPPSILSPLCIYADPLAFRNFVLPANLNIGSCNQLTYSFIFYYLEAVMILVLLVGLMIIVGSSIIIAQACMPKKESRLPGPSGPLPAEAKKAP